MSSAVANSNSQKHLSKHFSNASQMSKGDGNASEDLNEDYTSYKIIELLKHDKFMANLDNLNSVQAGQKLPEHLLTGELTKQKDDKPGVMNPLHEDINLLNEHFENSDKESDSSNLFDSFKEGILRRFYQYRPTQIRSFS